MVYNEENLNDVRNRLFESNFTIGKNVPNSMQSRENFAYRITGMNQIQDIIDFGYVRPKADSKYNDQVYWTRGGSVYFYDERPVLETSTDILKENNQMGAISLEQLTSIYIFDKQQNKYVNQIEMQKENLKNFEVQRGLDMQKRQQLMKEEITCQPTNKVY